MNAWVYGTTYEVEPGPSGAGVVYENGYDICMALTGWDTAQAATWQALIISVEYYLTEFEWEDRLTVYVSDPEIVKLATRNLKWAMKDRHAIEFFYLRKIAKKLRAKIDVVYGEVTRAEPIGQAAAEIAADSVGSEEAEQHQGEDAH